MTYANRHVLTELFQSDLHKIIVSPQALSSDHVKLFMYQLLRGELATSLLIGFSTYITQTHTINKLYN